MNLATGLMEEESESKATPTNVSNTIPTTPDSSTPADSSLDQHQQQCSSDPTTAVIKTGTIETPVTQPTSSEQLQMESKPSTTTPQRRFFVPKSRRRSTPQSPEEAAPVSSPLDDTSTVDALARRLGPLRISDTGPGASKLCSGFSSKEASRGCRFRPFFDSQSALSTSFVFLGPGVKVVV